MFKPFFESNGINAMFAVVAAKVSYAFGNVDSTIATATSFCVLVYAAILAATSSIRFIREVKTGKPTTPDAKPSKIKEDESRE